MKKNKAIDLAFEKGMAKAISDPEASYEIGVELLSNSLKNDDQLQVAKSYLLLAYSGQFIGYHAQSFEYVNLALPVLKEFEDFKNQASAYNTLGFIYYSFDDHENRLDVNLKSLEIRKTIKDTDGYMRSLNNTGDTYLKLGKYKEALELFNESLNLSLNNTRMLAVVKSNLSETYFFLEKYDLALETIEESITYTKKLALNDLLLYNLTIKSLVYNKLKDWKNSIKQLEYAIDLIKEPFNYEEKSLRELYKSASYAYEELGDYVQSLECLKKYFEIDKTIQNDKQKKEIKNILFKKEIASLQNRTTELKLTIDLKTKELKQALETEKHISYFTQELTDTNSLDEVLWKLVKSCISKLNLEDCVVYLLDKNKEVLTQKAAFGPKSTSDEKIENPISIRIGAGIVGSVAKYGKYELINDTSKDMRYIVDDDIRYSELAVPIFYENEVIGVIDSEHSEKHFFNDRHVSIFKMLASLVQSRIGKLREQEEKQKLQEKIILLNENLEKKIRLKSKENTQLNHKILEQEKKAIIGEMSTIITHELNTPLATIKGGNEAILFLFNKIINSGFIEVITKEELDFIIIKTTVIYESINSNGHELILEDDELHQLKSHIKDENLIKSILELNILKKNEIDAVLKFKNILQTFNILKDIYTINNFSNVIGKSVIRATNVVDELKSLAKYDENPEKQKILLIKNFEGLQTHLSLSQPEATFNIEVDPIHYIFGNEFRAIQLWSNIIHLIIDNCIFNIETNFHIQTIVNEKHKIIVIECNPDQVNTSMFNSNILSYRFYDDIEGAEKLKLNIIQSILIEHRAKLKCSFNEGLLQFKLIF